MSNAYPRIQTPIDVTGIKNATPAGKPVPTIVIRSEGDNSEGSDQNQGRVKLLEKIIKTEILLNILLILILIVALYISFVMRSDIQKYLNQNTQPGTQPEGSTLDFRVAAVEKEVQPEESSSVYINRLGVSLDRSFSASTSGKLTAHGRFK